MATRHAQLGRGAVSFGGLFPHSGALMPRIPAGRAARPGTPLARLGIHRGRGNLQRLVIPYVERGLISSTSTLGEPGRMQYSLPFDISTTGWF